MKRPTLLAALARFAPSAWAVSPTVRADCNTYQGASDPNGVIRWLGMRFAAAPIGELRFAPPQDPPCVKGIQQATSACLATGASPLSQTESEDCLFINVFAPTNASTDSNLPVFFFIQGGGFNANSNPRLDGGGLVQASNDSVVVVTINYRVGPYGFITDGDAIVPNNGLRDQRQALNWVQRHIAQFGGNPKHVVLGGASAGAASVAVQLTAFGGRDEGLFHGAAAESVSFGPVLTVSESQYQYDDFARRLNCSGAASLACLRRKTAPELQSQNHNIPYPGAAGPPLFMWNPVLDGDFIRDLKYNTLAAGRFVRVPTIVGDDTDGGTVFAPRGLASQEQSDHFLENQFPALTPAQLQNISALFPNEDTTCPRAGCYYQQASRVYGDMRYMCPGLFLSSAAAEARPHGGSGGAGPRSWTYRYDVRDAAQVLQGLGVPHVAELAALFGPGYTGAGAGAGPPSYVAGGSNAAVVPLIQAYWLSFIRALDPNPFRLPGAATWMPLVPTAPQGLLFETGGTARMEAVDARTRARCLYLWEIGPSLRQ